MATNTYDWHPEDTHPEPDLNYSRTTTDHLLAVRSQIEAALSSLQLGSTAGVVDMLRSAAVALNAEACDLERMIEEEDAMIEAAQANW